MSYYFMVVSDLREMEVKLIKTVRSDVDSRTKLVTA